MARGGVAAMTEEKLREILLHALLAAHDNHPETHQQILEEDVMPVIKQYAQEEPEGWS
jgi:hypothetical protein